MTRKSIFSIVNTKPNSGKNTDSNAGTKCPVCLKFIEGKREMEVLCENCFGNYEVRTFGEIKNL